MIDDSAVLALHRHWEDGFNAYDVDVVLEPVAADVVFSSPFVPVLKGDPEALTIDGSGEFRSYIADSMRRVPGIRYAIDATYVGTQTVVFVYTCTFPDGRSKSGSDSIRLDADGRIVEWRCHYSFAPEVIADLIQD